MAAEEKRDYSDVQWPWDDDPNWDQPREGATYDAADEENWTLTCGECGLHLPMDIEMRVVGDHWAGHHPGWTPDNQEPGLQLHLCWIGLGTPPPGREKRRNRAERRRKR
jgi:hypothetical protein